jgi:hypothetical protein
MIACLLVLGVYVLLTIAAFVREHGQDHGCKATNGLIALECIGAATQNGSGEKEFWPAVKAALVDTKGISVGSELATSSGGITSDSAAS